VEDKVLLLELRADDYSQTDLGPKNYWRSVRRAMLLPPAPPEAAVLAGSGTLTSARAFDESGGLHQHGGYSAGAKNPLLDRAGIQNF